MRYTVLGLNLVSAAGLYISYGFFFALAGLTSLLELMFDGNTEDSGMAFLMTCLPLLITTVVLIFNIIAQARFKKSGKFFAISETLCGVLSGTLYGTLIGVLYWINETFEHVSSNEASIRMENTTIFFWVLGIILNIVIIVLSIIASRKAGSARVAAA